MLWFSELLALRSDVGLICHVNLTDGEICGRAYFISLPLQLLCPSITLISTGIDKFTCHTPSGVL